MPSQLPPGPGLVYKSETLFLIDPRINSNKEYRAEIVWDGLEYHAVFRWGRRGSKLQSTSKACRTQEAARALVVEKLAEKRRKGYRSSVQIQSNARREIELVQTRAASQPISTAKTQTKTRATRRAKATQPQPPPIVTVRRIKLKD